MPLCIIILAHRWFLFIQAGFISTQLLAVRSLGLTRGEHFAERDSGFALPWSDAGGSAAGTAPCTGWWCSGTSGKCENHDVCFRLVEHEAGRQSGERSGHEVAEWSSGRRHGTTGNAWTVEGRQLLFSR